MYDATSGNPVSIGSLTGPLASILAYSSTPAGNIMTVGTLRFFVADTLNENVVMTSSDSVSSVDTLNVIELPTTWLLTPATASRPPWAPPWPPRPA